MRLRQNRAASEDAPYTRRTFSTNENLRNMSYLVARPETAYKQLYLKGRNLRVGQLIYKMRANDLTAEAAAVDMNLPIEQIREAEVYYQINRALIEQETAEEKQRLHAGGVRLESNHLPG